ncbi:VanZ family protein [Thauera linaloolentis]|uniref:VanZ-like domain-containing protein n=1 Tax=Thauera linaloolentis (strain DSM 12138 / JCM 21573 / CCUG 41526 / CIP 105981 / IAM 15112 / NBRC 102519 / 47Lol) TaxID=1123367 RepID=N6Z8A7_THAL4|nr:VanZ family protein [Thauera linaloolentis]ENO90583.1 hypothetical protein C666_00115 [Thauera linaloolentis 47Lol = DSM 12138]MCM8566089.1 VanZ family protein [Thauera linaloolentis]
MLALLILISVLIGYGSLYPFDFSLGERGLTEVSTFFTQPDLQMSRGDLVGNLLLFAPYGFVAASMAGTRKHHPASALAVLLGLGGSLALALQIAQLWLPSRVPALGDVFVNIAGMLLGVTAAGLARRLMPSLPGNRKPLIPLGLALSWLAYQWFPFVPTLDLQNITNALKPLLLSPQFDAPRTLHTAVAWLAFFKLWDIIAAGRTSSLMLAAVGVFIVGAKVLIVGAGISLNNVLGLGLALAFLRWRNAPSALPVLLIAMLLSLFLSGLAPFAIQSTPEAFHWIPFTGMLEGDMGNNLMNLIEKTYFYGALILLMARHGAHPVPASIAVAGCLIAVEAAQIFIAGRTAETTDPVLALILGFVIQLGISKRSAHHTRRPPQSY